MNDRRWMRAGLAIAAPGAPLASDLRAHSRAHGSAGQPDAAGLAIDALPPRGELLFGLTDTCGDNLVTVPPTPRLNQVRGFAGVGLQVASNVRLDVGFLMRSRPVPAVVPRTFDHALDEGLWLQLFVDVPGAGR